ncbi:MAG: hypothetical protein IJ958_07955 [Agathobacter sp.]|nr:hypothetical protein [Agathobacter sp.]
MDTSLFGEMISLFLVMSCIGGICSWSIYCPRKERAKRNKRRILCIGDSITFGSGVTFFRRSKSFPAALERLLGKEFQVLNYGIPGATMSLKSDKPYSESFFQDARNTNPEICLLMLGTNDSKPHNWNAYLYEKSLKECIKEVLQFPSKPQLYLMLPPAAFSVGGKPIVYEIRDEVIRAEVCPIVKAQAQKYNIGIIDLYSVMENHPEYFVDGVHPNEQGNQCIAEMIFKELKKDIGIS